MSLCYYTFSVTCFSCTFIFHFNYDSCFCFYVQTVALKETDHHRATVVTARLEAQQEKLNLPILPTTTIGSFPQTAGVRKVRREYKAGKKVSFLYYFMHTLNFGAFNFYNVETSAIILSEYLRKNMSKPLRVK